MVTTLYRWIGKKGEKPDKSLLIVDIKYHLRKLAEWIKKSETFKVEFKDL